MSAMVEPFTLAVPDADLRRLDAAFYDAFMREYDDQRGGYRASKVVVARISGGAHHEPVELLAEQQGGLYGFHSPPGEPEHADGPGRAYVPSQPQDLPDVWEARLRPRLATRLLLLVGCEGGRATPRTRSSPVCCPRP